MFRFRRTALASLAAIALAVGAGACDNGTGSESGTLSIRMMDAPGDFKKAVVTVSQIYLQPGNDSGAQRVVLSSTPVTTDLLTLANDVATIVQDASVPAGSYGQLRFVITGAYIEVEGQNGTRQIYATSPTYAGLPAGAQVTGQLVMPSFAQTGLKVRLPNGGITIGDEAKVLLVDFDVSRSFGRQAGASGTWVMSPVVTATDFQATGSLTSTVRLGQGVAMPAGTSLANAQMVLTSADSSVKALPVTANADGSYQTSFRYVVPGTYTVDVRVPGAALTTNPARPATVTVGSAQGATHAFTVTAATAAP